ncbi:hypothetical protein PAXINDRAFT_66325, partial [Paxillus involutus ATCC 200175]
PCLWQLKVAEVLLKGDKDILCTAGTGMGKTLGFGCHSCFILGVFRYSYQWVLDTEHWKFDCHMASTHDFYSL